MRQFVLLAAAALVIAGIAPRLLDRGDQAPAVSASPGMATEHNAHQAARAASVTFESDRSGHFRVEGSINGRRMEFLVDTGASVVALTARHAEDLGIFPGPGDFVVPIQTANGMLKAAQIRLAAVSVGPLRVRDVNAVVMPRGALAENLLGMSFLRGLNRFEIRAGRLILEQ